jgi:hypothetical protein
MLVRSGTIAVYQTAQIPESEKGSSKGFFPSSHAAWSFILHGNEQGEALLKRLRLTVDLVTDFLWLRILFGRSSVGFPIMRNRREEIFNAPIFEGLTSRLNFCITSHQ